MKTLLASLLTILVPWSEYLLSLREKLSQARCYVRYAIAPTIADGRAAATELKNWLSSQREVASQIFEQAAERCGAPEETELKTMAERAVDRVTHGMRLSKSFPAGF